LEKINVWRKNQNGGQKPRRRQGQVDFFSSEIQLKRHLADIFFWCKSVDNKVLFWKMSFGLLKFDKMATKFKMASETYIQKSTFFKRVVPTLNYFIFKSVKSNSVVQRPMIPKKIAKENFPRWRIFSTWRLYFFCVLKYVLWPLF
jgi:hypothetical protein